MVKKQIGKALTGRFLRALGAFGGDGKLLRSISVQVPATFSWMKRAGSSLGFLEWSIFCGSVFMTWAGLACSSPFSAAPPKNRTDQSWVGVADRSEGGTSGGTAGRRGRTI